MDFYIRKSSGELERFDVEKLKRSLARPGAPENIINDIVEHIKNNLSNFKSTDDIYRYALEELIDKHPHIAIRYNLKKALHELGPTGFPFERYVAEIFKSDGYKTEVDQIIKGWCVDHEVDIVLEKNEEYSTVECKFHIGQSYTTDVKVALYTSARFEDILQNWTSINLLKNCFLVTNTSFTMEAIKFGNCKKINLMSWNYPGEKSLSYLIDKFGLHPITALTSLTRKQKHFLVNNGLVLCRDAYKNIDLFKKLRLKNIDKIIQDANNASKI